MDLKNKNGVLAVIVTHNRSELLTRCIDYLWKQTHKPDILVIDNASTDNTKQYLLANHIDHITQENTGSAGGWWKGLREGWSRGYKYAWLMDDDGFPDKQALEELMQKWDPTIICISSLVVKENNNEELVFGMPKLNGNGLPVIFSGKRKFNMVSELPIENGLYPHAHLFNGALIDLEKAKKVGDVDLDFFMYGDEVDYFFRMKKVGKIYSCVSAIHNHPDVSKRSIDKKKIYYFIRNTIILNHRYFDYAALRDLLAVGVALVRILKRNGLIEFISYLVGKNSKYVWHGIVDGARHNRIKRF